MMPKFELAVPAGDELDWPRAAGLLPTRYPEIEVLDRRRSDDQRSEIWTCRAPARSHIERWCVEAGIAGNLLNSENRGGQQR